MSDTKIAARSCPFLFDFHHFDVNQLIAGVTRDSVGNICCVMCQQNRSVERCVGSVIGDANYNDAPAGVSYRHDVFDQLTPSLAGRDFELSFKFKMFRFAARAFSAFH